MSRITLTPSQTQFETQADETILEAALRQGYNLPNACQSGMCGTCVAQVVSGEVQMGEYDDCALTDEDAAAGMVLLCVCHAQGDVVLDLPTYEGAKAIAPRTMPARVAHIDVRGKMALLRLALPKSPPFKFYAGQYADILYKGTVRSYSLANAPSDNGVMEFHVRLREGGVFSPALFSGSLKVGDVLRVRAPLGAFTLNENSDKPLIFIATGTGFAPIKSLLHHLRDTQPSRSVHIYHGARDAAGLYDEAALRELLYQLPNARYTPVLSRADDAWQGARGYTTEHVLQDYADLSGYEVYACGSMDMIRGSKQAFVEQRGLPETAFYSDAFTPYVARTVEAG